MKAISVIRGDYLDGTLLFYQANKDSPVLIEGIINGLKPGTHAISINHLGDISNGSISTGGYFNPGNSNYNNNINKSSIWKNQRKFIGDLGTIYTSENGRTIINIRDNLISLFGDSNHNIIGRSVVIHETNQNHLNIYNGSNNYNLNLIVNGLGCGIIGIALEKPPSYL